MNKVKNISIPRPCDQSWQQMGLTANGRHCDVCCKTIIDFSLMGDDEVIGYLLMNNNVCARADEQQIKAINRRLVNANLFTLNKLKRLSVAFGLLSLVSYFKANAQVKASTVQTDTGTQHHRQVKAAMSTEQTGSITITGMVTDTLDLPVISASIVSLPGKEQVLTNRDGSFSFILPAGAKGFTIHSIGYIPQVFVIDPKKTETYAIKLHEDSKMLGEVSINGTRKLDSKAQLFNKLVDSLSRKNPK